MSAADYFAAKALAEAMAAPIGPDLVAALVQKWRWDADRFMQRRDEGIAATLRQCAADLEATCAQTSGLVAG